MLLDIHFPQMFLSSDIAHPTLVPEIVLMDLLFAIICFVYLSQCELVLLGNKLIGRSIRIWAKITNCPHFGNLA